jgi:hypothetical protein
MSLLRFLLAALIVAGCGGCGENSTSGSIGLTLTTTDLSGGVVNVAATAVYTPATGNTSIPNNTPITLSAHIYDLSGAVSKNESQLLNADSTGTVSYSFNIQQATENLYVDITASTGGLSITKTTSIPALSSISTTPTTMAFSSSAVAGDTQSVTVSGGTQPYQAALDASNAGDFTVNVNGSTVTLSKTKNSGTTVISAQLTITDNNGNSVTIPVSYF